MFRPSAPTLTRLRPFRCIHPPDPRCSRPATSPRSHRAARSGETVPAAGLRSGPPRPAARRLVRAGAAARLRLLGAGACHRGSSPPAPGRSPRSPWSRRCPPAAGPCRSSTGSAASCARRSQVAIRPEITAVLAEVLVDSGDAVEKGQPLVRLRARPAPAGPARGPGQRAAGPGRGGRRRARASPSWRRRPAAPASWPSRPSSARWSARPRRRSWPRPRPACSRRRRARRRRGPRWAARRSTLDKTVVRSPIAGRVGRREVEVGMLVTPATVLFVVGDLGHVVVDLPISEKMLAEVKAGMPVEIGGAALGDRKIAAQLSRMSPFLAAGSFTTTGEVELDNADGRLLPGMFVTADIAYGQSQAGHPGPGERPLGRPAHRPAGRVRGRPPPAAAARPATGESGPHPTRLRPVQIRRRGAGHRRRGGRGGGRVGGHHRPAPAGRQRAPVARACAPPSGSACSSCRPGSRSTCWPASWRSSSGWRAPGGVALPPRPSRIIGEQPPRPPAGKPAPATHRHDPERPPCRYPQLSLRRPVATLDGLPHPAGGGRRLLAQPARRPAAQGGVHPARPCGCATPTWAPRRSSRSSPTASRTWWPGCPTWSAWARSPRRA